MAESIGGKIRNVLVAVLIGLLVLAFALWGINDVFTAGIKDAAVTVGKEKITLREFKLRFDDELQAQNRQNGTAFTTEQAYNQGLHNQVLGQMQTELVIAKDAADLGIGADHELARNLIRNNPAFQNEVTQKFSKELYESRVRRIGKTTEQYEADLFRDIRRMQTVPAIIGGLSAPSDFATQKYNFATEQRKASLLTINKDAVPVPDAPDDETLKAFVDRNAAKYTAPEYRQVLVLRLENADFAKDLTVTDEEIKTEFDRRVAIGQLGSNESRSFAQIDVDNEPAALKIVERLQRGDDPEDVTAGMGLPAPEIYTDVLPDAVLIPEASDAAFATDVNEAKAVEGGLGGWHVVLVTAITPAVTPVMDDVREEISEAVLNNKAADAVYQLSKTIDDGLLENRTLEELSEAVNFPYASYDYIDRSGTTRDGIKMSGFGAIPGLAADDDLLREIFVSDIQYETDIIRTKTDGFATIKVVDVIDSQLRPFDEIKEQALSDWTDEQTETALAAFSVTLSQRLQDGETFDDIANELGDAAQLEERIITRLTPPREVSPQVVVDLLSGDVGDIVRGPGIRPLTRQIAKLERIAPNRDAIAGEYLDYLRDQATVEISSDLIQAYQQDVLFVNGNAAYPEQIKSTLGLSTPE